MEEYDSQVFGSIGKGYLICVKIEDERVTLFFVK